MPLTCQRCGREAERSEQFCQTCGNFLGWAEGQQGDSVLLTQPRSTQERQRAGVQIRLENDLIEVAPGSAESTAFVVKNLGTKVEEFQFLVTGPEWIIAEPATVSVYPGQEATGAVQVAPPRTPNCPAGTVPFQLTVTSALHSNLSGSAAGQVDVAPYYEFTAELVPSNSRGRGWTRHTIKLDNRGNTPLRILLNPTDAADGLRLSLSPVAEVGPGDVTEVQLAVHGRRRWFGRPEPKTFAVTAEAPKPLAPQRLAGTRVLVPIFPWWVPLAATGAATAIVAAALIVHHVVGQPKGHPSSPPPSPSTSPTTTSTPSPSTSTSSSPVAVPDVTGFTSQLAQSTLSGRGFTPELFAKYDPNTTVGTVIMTAPAANQPAAAGSTVQVDVSTGKYDMYLAASNAEWYATNNSNPAMTVTFGQQNIATGAAFSASEVLEDGSMPQDELEMHPPEQDNFFIWGIFTPQDPLIAGEQFRADIGFPKGTGGTIGYQVFEIDANGTKHMLGSGTHTAGSQLGNVTVDIPAKGKQLKLVVWATDLSPINDAVIWVAPRVEAADAPPESQSPTPSPSPSPSPSST